MHVSTMASGQTLLTTSGSPLSRRLIALRGCTLNQTFVEIVQSAKTHDVSTLSLA